MLFIRHPRLHQDLATAFCLESYGDAEGDERSFSGCFESFLVVQTGEAVALSAL